MAFHDDVRTSSVALTGIIGAIVVVLLVVLLQALYFNFEVARRQADDQVPIAEINDLLAKQQSTLGSYRWVDEKNQIAAIPVSRAMELVVREIAARPESATPAAVEKKPEATKPAEAKPAAKPAESKPAESKPAAPAEKSDGKSAIKPGSSEAGQKKEPVQDAAKK